MTSPSRLRARTLGFACVTLLLAGTAAGQMALGDSPEEWMVLSISGQPGGYLHTVLREDDDGRTATWMDMRMKLSRVGTVVQIAMEASSLEARDGTVLRLTSVTAAPGETRAEAVVDGDVLRVTVEESVGGTREFTEPWCGDCKGIGWWVRELTRWLPDATPGDVFTMRTYELSLGSAVTTDYTLVSRSEDGEVLLEGETDLFPGIKQFQRMDSGGRIVAMSTAMAGLSMELVASTRAEALAAYEGGGFAPEVFAQTTFRPDVPLPRPRSLDRVVYGLRPRDPAIPFPDFDSARQTVLGRQDDGRLLLEVRRVVPGDRDRTPGSQPPEDEYLAPNATIQSDAEQVVALAESLAGPDDDPWETARRLERGVYEYIDSKSMDVAFGTAAEVCLSRTGDCTEHAVLLAALCRARGIPARVAMGVLYLRGIFGGHAWTEVWIDGEWIALDATLGLGSVDAAHIRFGASALSGLGMGAEMFGSLSGLGNLDVAILEIETDGRTRRMDGQRGASFTIADSTLTSHDYGFRLTAPHGFTWDPEVPEWTAGYVARAWSDAEGNDAMYLRARAVDYAFDEDELAAFLGDEEVSIAVRVDGRPGLVGDFGSWKLGVLDGDTVIEVVLESDDDDDDEALETLLGLAGSLVFTG